ncbi:MAG: hypothetical protein RLZZ214_4312 [Verrucomicrobiota bacterium]
MKSAINRPSNFTNEKLDSLSELFHIFRAELVSKRAISTQNIDLRLDYKCCNPSFFPYKDEIRGIVRTVNYIKENRANTTYFTTGNQWDTINHYVSVSAGKHTLLNRISDSEFRIDGIGENGLEDLRVFTHLGNYFVIGSLASQTPISTCTIFIAEFNPDHGTIHNLNMIPSPVGSPREKNWMPFEHNDELFVIYDFQPLVIYALKKTAGVVSLGQKKTLPTPLLHNRKYSGGTNLISYKKGFLGIIHRRIVLMGKSYYKHAFIHLNERMSDYQISREFFFRSKGIEFAISLFSSDHKLYVGNSELDRRAWLDCYDCKVLSDLGLNL